MIGTVILGQSNGQLGASDWMKVFMIPTNDSSNSTTTNPTTIGGSGLGEFNGLGRSGVGITILQHIERPEATDVN